MCYLDKCAILWLVNAIREIAEAIKNPWLHIRSMKGNLSWIKMHGLCC